MMSNEKFPLICVGPTASGKPAWRAALAQRLDGGGVRRLYADLSGNVHRNGEAKQWKRCVEFTI